MQQIAFIVTEHPRALPERKASYDTARATLQEVSGLEVAVWQYLECDAGTWAADAVVLSGSSAPWAWHRTEDLDALGAALRDYPGPVFGVCAGLQLLARFAGGEVGRCPEPEKGFTPVGVDPDSPLFRGVDPEVLVYEYHTDQVESVPAGARVTARSTACAVQALEFEDRPWWGTQFHPEMADGDHPAGRQILANAFDLLRSRPRARTA